MLTKDEKLVEQIKTDFKKAEVDEKTMAMLLYAEKLTIKPSSVTEADINHLKDLGCSEREILDLCQITAYFNFVNRIAEGLGIQLEDEYK